MAYFSNITHLTHFYIWGVKCSGHFFFLLFLGKTGQITRYLWKKTYGHQLQPMTHFFTKHKFDLLSYISIINFLNLPVCALIHDLQKKNLWASTRTHDPFSDNSKIWPTFIYRGEVSAHTFAKLPVHALINDPKKLFQKKVYVTIPQWFETFPNMSDLWSGRNRAKCGLLLNDPIDWFKLRLNQPKNKQVWIVCGWGNRLPCSLLNKRGRQVSHKQSTQASG